MTHKRLKYIIVKTNHDDPEHWREHEYHERKHDDEDVTVQSKVVAHDGKVHDIKFDLPYEQTANALMSANGYVDYVKKHGYHFTEPLAENVSAMMKNASGMHHTWTAQQVKRTMESLGLIIPANVTLGDVTYLANMYYADLYPEVLGDEASCLRAAYMIANDVDGYKGMVFCRWTADAIGKAVKIDWEQYV